MKERRRAPRKLIGDRWLIGIVMVLNVALLLIAQKYLRNLNDLAETSYGKRPVAEETLAILELERVAKSSTWEGYEKARSEQTSYYFNTKTRPNTAAALYFFPEVLPKESFEHEFLQSELTPAILGLRRAVSRHSAEDAKEAMELLRTRVANYELGAETPKTALSDEAQVFLRTFEALSNSRALSSEPEKH